MEQRIGDLLAMSGMPRPETDAELLRCVFESIALKVARNAAELSLALGRRFSRIRIISGGSRFTCLTTLVAEALGMPVSVGLPSATLVGNAVSQFVGLGELSYDSYSVSDNSGAPVFKEIYPVGSEYLRDESRRSVESVS